MRPWLLTRLRAPAPAAVSALTVLALGAVTGCSGASQVRTEDVAISAGAAIDASTSLAGADEPFDREAISTTLLSADLGDLGAVRDKVLAILQSCADCLELTTPAVVDERKVQLATVSVEDTGQSIAGFAISSELGEPEVSLMIGGTGVRMHPGVGETIVVEESLYDADDEFCCPSGWSVQVYRAGNAGGFEAGQRITGAEGDPRPGDT